MPANIARARARLHDAARGERQTALRSNHPNSEVVVMRILPMGASVVAFMFCGAPLFAECIVEPEVRIFSEPLRLIRFRGHFPKGGYDVGHGGQETERDTAQVHG
jgi:hypothetical protein